VSELLPEWVPPAIARFYAERIACTEGLSKIEREVQERFVRNGLMRPVYATLQAQHLTDTGWRCVFDVLCAQRSIAYDMLRASMQAVRAMTPKLEERASSLLDVLERYMDALEAGGIVDRAPLELDVHVENAWEPVRLLRDAARDVLAWGDDALQFGNPILQAGAAPTLRQRPAEYAYWSGVRTALARGPETAHVHLGPTDLARIALAASGAQSNDSAREQAMIDKAGQYLKKHPFP